MRYYDSVTVVTPGSKTDRYNNVVVDWTTATNVDTPALAYPTTTTERDASGDKVVSHMQCHVPASVAITAQCRVVYRGKTYEIDGEPQLFMRRAVPDHYEMALKRVEG